MGVVTLVYRVLFPQYIHHFISLYRYMYIPRKGNVLVKVYRDCPGLKQAHSFLQKD